MYTKGTQNTLLRENEYVPKTLDERKPTEIPGTKYVNRDFKLWGDR